MSDFSGCSVLVTGGAGFIGSHLVERLVSEGAAVCVIDNFSTGSRENLAPFMDCIDLHEQSITDPAACAAACVGIDYVLHQAALPSVSRSVSNPIATHDVSATGTLNMLVAANDAGVRRLVYAGSSSAYGDTPTLPKHEGHGKVLDLLLKAGADPMMRGSYWCISAVTVSATGDCRQYLPAIVKAAPGPLDIFHACVLGETARVKTLLKKDRLLASTPDTGSRIWTSEEGWFPLHYCARSHVGDDDTKKGRALAQITQLLLDHGADPTGCVDQAVGNLAVLEALLLAGGKVADDDTVHHAACEGHVEALKLLMEHGTALDGTRGTDHQCREQL